MDGMEKIKSSEFFAVVPGKVMIKVFYPGFTISALLIRHLTAMGFAVQCQ